MGDPKVYLVVVFFTYDTLTSLVDTRTALLCLL